MRRNFKEYRTNPGPTRDSQQIYPRSYPLVNHRTPVKNLYATGACWHVGSNAGSSESYNCYKIIAKDMNLDNPWNELGDEETESLVESIRGVVRRAQQSR